MIKQNFNLKKGITLIALVITIVILIILAGVALTLVLGSNGILQRTKDAKDKTTQESEKESINLISATVKIDESTGVTLDTEKFQKIIDDTLGKNTATGEKNDSQYYVTVLKSQDIYKINTDGSVIELGKADNLKKDDTPGILSGSGTQDDPYVIYSIEDLVALAYNVNSGANSYESKYITLGRSLFFDGSFDSYANPDSKYEVKKDNNYLLGYIPSTTSSTTIKELCTSNNGFIPIGIEYTNSSKTSINNEFKGKGFDGKENIIDGLYESGFHFAGLFGFVGFSGTTDEYNLSNIKIIDCNISGGILVGGLIGFTNRTTILNCCTNGEIKGGSNTGGIVGDSDNNTIIKDCYNTANITGGFVTGGIVSNNAKIINCYNIGNVITNSSLCGGITATTDNIIENCYNTGDVTTNDNTPVGGIAGSSNQIINCYNTGNVTGKSVTAGISGSNNNQIINCYNIGKIIGQSLTGGILGSDGAVTNCYNTGDVTGKSSPTGGIAGYSSSITGCYNSGKVSGNNSYIVGEITYSTTTGNYYQIRDVNAKADGATGKTEAEMKELMAMQKFIDLMNSYVSTNNANSSNDQLLEWKMENGLPVFNQ